MYVLIKNILRHYTLLQHYFCTLFKCLIKIITFASRLLLSELHDIFYQNKVDVSYSRVVLPQVKRLTVDVMQALDNVAAITLKQMVTGGTVELKMDGNVMLMVKDYVYVIANETFSFSPISGFDSGLSVRCRITEDSGELTSSDEILGIKVSISLCH